MLGLTLRLVLATIAVAAAALTSAAIAPATPQGPCADVPYAGVCTPWRPAPQRPSGKSDVNLPVFNSNSQGGSQSGPQSIEPGD